MYLRACTCDLQLNFAQAGDLLASDNQSQYNQKIEGKFHKWLDSVMSFTSIR